MREKFTLSCIKFHVIFFVELDNPIVNVCCEKRSVKTRFNFKIIQ